MSINTLADIEMGRIVALFGVRGWVKVQSHTEPRENLLNYRPWQLCQHDTCRSFTVTECQRHGKGLVAKLEGIEDRDAAAKLVGARILVPRAQLPDAGAGEFYWTDLLGLQVVSLEGEVLGCVDHLLATGANDVLVVRDAAGHERLIPFIPDQVVRNVDLSEGRIEVDWDPAF